MNEIVEQIQQKYRKERDLCNFSIMDIGMNLKNLAEKGMIWVLKDQKDISEYEEIMIEFYLNKYRVNQNYDNLDNLLLLPTSKEEPTRTPFQPSPKVVPAKDQMKKQQHILYVKNVKQFSGYKKAKELEEKITELCKNYPSYERDHIVDQIERSANSIKKSIALGEQIYVREKFNHYSIAVGSAKETISWLQMSLGQKYISQEQFVELDNLVTQVVSILTRTLTNIRENEGYGLDLPNPFTPDVKNFNAYQDALLLVEKIYEMTRKREFWKERDIIKGLRKNATSCVANIAESNQFYIDRKFSFINNALGALSGLCSWSETSMSKRIITKEDIVDIEKIRVSIRNILLRTLANISKRKAS
jgi:four helix bundle protein